MLSEYLHCPLYDASAVESVTGNVDILPIQFTNIEESYTLRMNQIEILAVGNAKPY